MMNPILKWSLIIGGIIAFFAVVIGLYFVFIKPASPAPAPSPDPDPDGNGNGSGDCLTAPKYQIKKEECHKKCASNLFIPFLGLGYYKLCNHKCVDKITPIC